MDKFIANVTAQKPLGIPTGRKCLIVNDGPYSGRMVILYASSATTITMVTADPPYSSFSLPEDIITTSAESPFDAAFNENHDILLTFIDGTVNDLRFRRLTFENGNWTPGSTVVVYDGSQASNPMIRKMSDGLLWIIYAREDSGSYYLCGKSSADDGDSWTPSSDPGDTLSGGAASIYGIMVERGAYQYVIYAESSSKLACRNKPLSAMIWSSETVLAAEGGYGEDFHAATSSDGRIGLTYDSLSGLKFREFNGNYWSAEVSLDSNGGLFPVAGYHGGNAYILYFRATGPSMNQVFYVKQDISEFSQPQPVDARRAAFAAVLVFNAAAGTYRDKTIESESEETADVFHDDSGALLGDIDDALYLGCEKPFNLIRLILSTSGSGGEVIWKYWDGQNWKAFTPHSGPWHFSHGSKDILLWDDFNSVPADWQKKAVFGQEYFWICIAVSSAFVAAPVGSCIKAVSNLKAISAQE